MKALRVILLLAIVGFAGCSKDGEPGPQGPKGDQGEQGTQGEQGLQGEPGTANVMYSEWITPEWYESSANYLIWYQTDENMTEDIVDKGMVHIYYKDNTYNHVRTLTNPPADVSFTVILRKYTSSSEYTIYLGAYSADASDLETLETNYKFRYVLVPGAVLTGGRKADLDYENYEAVKAHFGIPD